MTRFGFNLCDTGMKIFDLYLNANLFPIQIFKHLHEARVRGVHELRHYIVFNNMVLISICHIIPIYDREVPGLRTIYI